MKRNEKQRNLMQKRRWRIRKKIIGTAGRPRLSLCLSNKHIYAQCIDDRDGITLCSLSSLSKDLKAKNIKPNLSGAAELGKLFAQAARGVGISTLSFDRGGRRFHGSVKAFADAARESGLVF